MRTRKMACEGCCEALGGCYGEVLTVVVSRVGELNLCKAAVEGFQAAEYVVSNLHTKYVGENNRGEPDSEVLRALGHFLTEDVA